MAVTSTAACPKCGSPASAGALECSRCGLIFARFQQRVAEAARHSPDVGVQPITPQFQQDPLAGAVRVGRGVVLAALIVWTWQFARAPIGAGVMDSVLHLPNLVFHEAGHVLFSLFGRFMTVLGGSLFQVLVPVVCAVAFLRQRDVFAAAVCSWWAGQNLLDLAPYIADARALQLVLLGGHTGAEVEGHEWENLLTALGWMQHDRTLGLAAHWLGLAIMATAIAWGAMHLARSGRPVQGSGPPVLS
jgi:hypothetical protein